MLYPKTKKIQDIKEQHYLVQTDHGIKTHARYGGWMEDLPKWLEVIW